MTNYTNLETLKAPLIEAITTTNLSDILGFIYYPAIFFSLILSLIVLIRISNESGFPVGLFFISFGGGYLILLMLGIKYPCSDYLTYLVHFMLGLVIGLVLERLSNEAEQSRKHKKSIKKARKASKNRLKGVT